MENNITELDIQKIYIETILKENKDRIVNFIKSYKINYIENGGKDVEAIFFKELIEGGYYSYNGMVLINNDSMCFSMNKYYKYALTINHLKFPPKSNIFRRDILYDFIKDFV